MRFLPLAALALALTALTASPATGGTPSPEAAARVVYLTFDDGPSPASTAPILAVLAQHRARATFFALGSQLKAYPALARRIAAEGHTIANHTYNHVDLTRVGEDHLYAEVDRTHAVIRKLTGRDSTLLRPPYGASNSTVRALAARRGYRVVLWDVDPQDWRRPGAGTIATRILRQVRPGSIVLLHDGGGDRSQTVAALRTVLPALARRGYGFSVLPEPRVAAATTPVEAPELAFDQNGWIYSVRSDGTELRRLVRGSSPAWSPDGTRIAYSRFDRIYVANADGSGERRLTAAGRGFGVSWSPDGRRIAFTSVRSGRLAVYVAKADGRDVRPLVRPATPLEEGTEPAWSPDGRRIVFANTRSGVFNPELFSVGSDGRGMKRLTWTAGSDAALGDDGAPSWSPDAASIAFSSNRSGDGAIWTMRANGSQPRKIADTRGSNEVDPDYSADGRTIAFAQESRGVSTLWLVGANGAGLRKLVGGNRPAWRPTVP